MDELEVIWYDWPEPLCIFERNHPEADPAVMVPFEYLRDIFDRACKGSPLSTPLVELATLARKRWGTEHRLLGDELMMRKYLAEITSARPLFILGHPEWFLLWYSLHEPDRKAGQSQDSTPPSDLDWMARLAVRLCPHELDGTPEDVLDVEPIHTFLLEPEGPVPVEAHEWNPFLKSIVAGLAIGDVWLPVPAILDARDCIPIYPVRAARQIARRLLHASARVAGPGGNFLVIHCQQKVQRLYDAACEASSQTPTEAQRTIINSLYTDFERKQSDREYLVWLSDQGGFTIRQTAQGLVDLGLARRQLDHDGVGLSLEAAEKRVQRIRSKMWRRALGSGSREGEQPASSGDDGHSGTIARMPTGNRPPVRWYLMSKMSPESPSATGFPLNPGSRIVPVEEARTRRLEGTETDWVFVR